jgi:putative acetyltransferase
VIGKLCLKACEVKASLAEAARVLPLPGNPLQKGAMIDHLHIVEDDLTGADIAALLRLHLEEMHAWSPPCSVHAMPLERLRAPDVTFYAAWDGARLAGCGAIKALDPRHGELKSMRAHPDYRGRGVGKALLRHLLGVAAARGYTRVSLETGSPAEFEPAHQLYLSHGFAECVPFADYGPDPFSRYMTLEIA